jgi:CRISPR/Cas system-associated exonuclease Cas4 (RecB family)
MIDIVGAVEKTVLARIKRIPCKSNRASSVGYFVPSLNGCLRRGVLERTHWQEKEMPDIRLQMIFDEGYREERTVLRMLDDAGITVNEQQSCGEWEKYNITWHLDGVILDDGNAIPIEIKSMAPHIYDAINTLEDFHKKPWTRSYLAQIQLYLLGKNVEKGIFILKNKSTGRIKTVEVKLDYALAEECIKVCEAINKHVADGTMPERIKDVEVCRDCPMKTSCAPGMNFGAELKIADDPMFEQRLDRFFELKPNELECKDVYELIKDRIKATAKGQPVKLMVGKYMVEGKPDAKGAMRLNIEKQ